MQFQKISILRHPKEDHWKFQGGGGGGGDGGGDGGGGVETKNPTYVGGVWIFSGTTQSIQYNINVFQVPLNPSFLLSNSDLSPLEL